MSLARLKTWLAGEVVTSASLNAEFDNILANPTTLISPLARDFAAGSAKITGLAAGTAAGNSVRFQDVLAVATQANQETGTSLAAFVTPGRQQFHPSAAKCWALVTYSGGTPTLAVSYNITSITDSGTGDLLITIATDFSSASWSYDVSNEIAGAVVVSQSAARAAGTLRIITNTTASSSSDPASIGFTGFGDQ